MKGISLLTGLAAGAGWMYYMDRERGKRRRAGVRDQMVSKSHRLQREVSKAARDVENRATGFTASLRRAIERAWTGAPPPSDEVVAARVRSKLGRVVSHPRAVETLCQSGVVTLRGHILSSEADKLLQAVEAIPGVNRVENQLDVHETAEGISSLQGEGRNGHAAPHTGWRPAARLLAGAGGGALALYGASRGGFLGTAAGATGVALLGKAAGVGTRQPVLIRKTVHVNAPVSEVFGFLTNFTNLPRFMSHLVEVRSLGKNRYHWVAEGPAGIPVAWDGEVKRQEQDRLVEWKSLPGSVIANEGSIRFDAEGDGKTRVTVSISYEPPGGVIGHVVAAWFGADPKTAMDDDFVRMKALIERGRTRAHGEVVTAESVNGSESHQPQALAQHA